MELPLFNVNDCVMIFTDEESDAFGSGNPQDLAPCRRNSAALAKASAFFKVPVVRSMQTMDSTNSSPTPFLRFELAGISIIDQYTAECLDNDLVREAVLHTRRGALIFAGRLSEPLISYSILSALAETYDVLIAVDACDGLSSAARSVALRRMAAAGATMTTSRELLLRFEAERQWFDDAESDRAAPIGPAGTCDGGIRSAATITTASARPARSH